MKGGWLEHEIRSLPHVLACSINADDVVVMVEPSADPVAVEASVRAVLAGAGRDVPVRVFGGARPLYVEPIRVRNGRSALVSSLGGAAILAAGVWLAGATAGLRGGPKTKAPVTMLAPPRSTGVYTLPVTGGDGPNKPPDPLIPQEVTPPAPILRPVRLARLGSGSSVTHHPSHRPQTRPPARPPAVRPPPVTQPPPVDGGHGHHHEHKPPHHHKDKHDHRANQYGHERDGGSGD